MRGSRASPSNYYPLLSDYSCALAKRGLDSVGRRRPPGPAPAARPPGRSLSGTRRARALGLGPAPQAPGARRRGADEGCTFPLVPPSPCQPGVRVFVFTSKRNDTKVENESDEQTKEGEGLGNKVVCWPQRLRTRSRRRKKIFGQSVQKDCLSQELRNFSVLASVP